MARNIVGRASPGSPKIRPCLLRGRLFFLCLLFLLLGAPSIGLAQLQVVGTAPGQNGFTHDPQDSLVITFDRPLNTATLNTSNIRLSGEYQGIYQFSSTLSSDGATLTLRAVPGLIAGETIQLTLTNGLQGSDGSSLTTPFQLTFRTRPTRGDINIGLFPVDIPLSGSDQQPTGIAIGDFDKNNFVDAAVVSSTSNTLTIMINIATPDQVGVLIPLNTYVTGVTPLDLAVADFDNDSFLDIAVINFNSNDLVMFWGDGTGAFAADNPIPLGSRPSGIAAADFAGGDGLVDFAVSLFGDDQVLVYSNSGGRNFSLQSTLFAEESTYGVAAADFDADGDPDLAAINNGSQSVSIYRNIDFTGWQTLPVQALDQRPVDLQWGNVRHELVTPFADPLPELVVLSSDLTLLGKSQSDKGQIESQVTVFEYNPGNGQMVNVQEIPYDGTAVSFDIANLDYDVQVLNSNDLDLDLMIADYTSGQIEWLENQSGSAFADSETPVATGLNPRAVVTADFDRDGDDDILFARHFENNLGLLVTLPNDLQDIGGIDTLIHFGDVQIGDTVEIVVPYDPDLTLNMNVVSELEDEEHFDIQPRQFPVTNGEAVPITFSFMPSDTISYFTVSTFLTNHPLQVEPDRVVLTGRGVDVNLTVIPDTLDFGVVPPGQLRSLNLLMVNSGNARLQIESYQSGLDAFIHSAGPDVLPAGEALNFPVTFAPTAEGDYLDTLRIASNDRDQPVVEVILIGASSIGVPQITSADTVTAIEDQLFTYEATAIDPEGEAINFSFPSLANWMSADSNVVSGTPRHGDENTTFRIVASDGFLADTLDVFVIVIQVNDPPIIDSLASQQVEELELLSFTVTATDEEGEPLSMSARDLPSGATFVDQGNNSGLFSWTPAFGTVGTYPVIFRAQETVSVPALADEDTVLITVGRRLPDIAVTAFALSNANTIFLNQSSDVAATITNTNAPVTESFTIRMALDGQVLFDSTVTGMEIGETISVSRNVTFDELGAASLVIHADPDALVPELDEENNRRELILDIQPGALVVRPNPFTPNGDSKNDAAVFDMKDLGVSNPLLEIFDISGRKIRSLQSVLNDQFQWDGANENGEQQMPGIYLYILKDGPRSVAKGFVALAR